MKKNREEFLSQLELVSPGLSAKEVIEQSSCFIFKEGKVVTSNGEIYCSAPCEFPFEGAVDSKALMALLSKLPDDFVTISHDGSSLNVRGKGRRAKIRSSSEIIFPFHLIDKPKLWKRLPADFISAVEIIKECAASSQAVYVLTCVHLHPERIEAGDEHQTAQIRMDTRLSSPVLIRKENIRHICDGDLIRFSETDSWIHFKSKQGFRISFRRNEDHVKYPVTTSILEIEGGTKTPLPSGVQEICERAEIFSAENPDDNLVRVVLTSGKMQISGEGMSGEYTERKQTQYKGPDIEFLIPPKILVQLTEKFSHCLLTEDKLKIEEGSFSYVTMLGVGPASAGDD